MSHHAMSPSSQRKIHVISVDSFCMVKAKTLTGTCPLVLRNSLQHTEHPPVLFGRGETERWRREPPLLPLSP